MVGKGTLTPAVAYVRMSGRQQEASPGQQRAEIAKLAEKYHCRVVREYFDEAISGDATDKRKGFLQMVRDAEEKRDFAAILCWDQDRFGRFDSIEAGRWIYPLRKAGVWLITVAQGRIDWNDFAGRMMYSIQQEGKHQYLVDLSRNVLRGRLASAKKGGLIVSPPYGYDRVFFDATGKETKRVAYGEKFSRPAGWTVSLVPAAKAEEVETVRWLFQEFADSDTSLRRLVLDLNARGSRTRRGRHWCAVAVEYMLTHPVYIGTYTFGRRRGGKYHQVNDEGELTQANGHGLRSAPIVKRDHHEGIVDPDVFARVQEKLRQRRGQKSKPRYNGYILTGILHCGHCGGPMCGKTTSHKDRAGHRYYYCPGNATGECGNYSVRQDAMDAYVLDTLAKRLLSPAAVREIEKAILERARDTQQFRKTTDGLKARITALDAKIAKGTENLLLASPDDFADLSDLLATWRRERRALQTELEATATKADGRTAEERAARAMAELKRLRQHLTAADPLKVRAVVKSLILDVKLYWEPKGKRSKVLTHGELTLRSENEVLQCFHSIVPGGPRGSGGP
ncbi:MAG: recombinase family protein [Pirellulales bacterium]